MSRVRIPSPAPNLAIGVPPMKKALLFALAAGVAFGQYKMETAGAPPTDLPPAFASLLQQQGVKILAASGSVYGELWLRTQAPSGPKSTEDAVALSTIPQGALLGVIRFTGPAQDRRGQPHQAGVYTLRYSLYPVNGDHQGVAPQRDFALLVPIEPTTPTPAPRRLSTPWWRSAPKRPALRIRPCSASRILPVISFPISASRATTIGCSTTRWGSAISIILVGKVEGSPAQSSWPGKFLRYAGNRGQWRLTPGFALVLPASKPDHQRPEPAHNGSRKSSSRRNIRQFPFLAPSGGPGR